MGQSVGTGCEYGIQRCIDLVVGTGSKEIVVGRLLQGVNCTSRVSLDETRSDAVHLVTRMTARRRSSTWLQPEHELLGIRFHGGRSMRTSFNAGIKRELDGDGDSSTGNASCRVVVGWSRGGCPLFERGRVWDRV